MIFNEKGKISFVKAGFVGGLVVCLLFFVACLGSIIEKNDMGYYRINQSITGVMSIKQSTGYYAQNFATVTKYKVSDVLYFSKHKIDGGDNAYTQPVTVTFNGNSKADISGVLTYRLPKTDTLQLKIHEDYRSGLGLKDALIRQYVSEVLIQTAPLMTAEEAYAPRKTEFKQIAQQQLIQGIFKKQTRTITINETYFNEKGEKKTQHKKVKIVELVLNDVGLPIIETPSPLEKYGIQVINFALKDFDFDDKTEELIAKKKESEMQKVLSETDAQRAQQDAIRVIAEGKKRFAEAEANANVEKVTATISAEKSKAVAELKAQQDFNVARLEAEKKLEVAKLGKQAAEEDAKAALIKGQADARVAKLKVAAGLTPREKAEFEMRTAIGVAEQLSNTKFPNTMIVSGGNSGKALSPIEVVGLEATINLADKFNKKTK